MNPPPAPERRVSVATEAAAPVLDASVERGAPASRTAIASTTRKKAPLTGGLHDTAVSNSKNYNEIDISTRGDSPCKPGSSYLEAHLDDISVQDSSKQAVSSDGTRKRNFQPGNRERHASTCGSSSRAPEISMVETKDARSKFQKKSDNGEQLREEGKDTGLVEISEELKENENRSSLNSSCLKDEKEQKNGSRGQENNKEAPKCMGSSVLDSNQPASSNVSQGGLDSNVKTNCLDTTTGEYFYPREDFIKASNVVSNENVKTNCLDSTTGEYFYPRKDFTKSSDVVSRHYSSEERRNLGSLKHMGETIPHTSLNNQKNQSYPFNESANFIQIGTTYPSLRADGHHSMDIHGGAMAEYGFGRSYLDHTSTDRNRMQERELAYLSTYHNINRIRPSYPFNKGADFFQVGMADPNFRAGVHHSMNIYGSGAMANPNFRSGVHHSMNIYGSGAMADPNFRSGVHHSMGIYGSGTIADPNFRAGVHHGMDIYGSGTMANPNFRAGVHQSMDTYGSGAMAHPNFRAGAHRSMDTYGSGAMAEYEFGRSYFHHTSTERNKMQEKELVYPTYHNINRITPSSLPQEYSENVGFTFSRRHSLVGVRKKKLLILDLNGLLADINEDIHNAHMADAKVRGKLVFRRPYCDDFLNFCIQNFELGIWSSRKRKNVDSVVDILMRDLKPYLLFSWDRSKCTITGHKTLENMHKPIVLKELRKLWNKEEPDLPWVEGEFSPSNTLLVDDSPYKALRNPPYSAIFPHPFSYLNRKDNSLGPGGDLRVYLENLIFADDVECFVRNHPFGQPFITPSDPHWNFYAEIAGEGYGSVTCHV